MKSSGFAAIPLLVCCALTAVAITTIYFQASETVWRRRNDVHSTLANERAVHLAISALRQPNHINVPKNTGITCSKQSAINGEIEISASLCGKFDKAAQILPSMVDGTILADKATFPQFDFNSILEKHLPCQYSSINAVSNSSLGFTLSPSAQISRRTCRNPLGNLLTAHIYRGNIEQEFDSSLTSPSGNASIAATGFIDINATLAIGGSLAIVAAGDIHIRELSVVPGQTADITILSATGAVVIDAIEGQPNLRLIAWLGAFAPPNQGSDPNGSDPMRLWQQVIGFRDLIN